MPFATWWRGDPLPDLSPLPTFFARISTDIPLLARLANLSEQEIQTRIHAGNHAYLAFMDSIPAAYGWVATQAGGIAALQFSFTIFPGNCYLWDFLTLPLWRTHGIYPRLLQAIIHQEQHMDRFWIGYAAGNEVSARGMQKAGFDIVSEFVFSQGHIRGLTLFNPSEHARESARFFQLPIVTET